MVRPTKRTNSGKTKVITFKLPTDEEFLISAYTESAKISKSEFLTKIINHYLLIDFSLEIHDKTLISHLVDTLNIKRNQFKDGKLHVLSVRVPRNDLEFWDFYCE